MAKRQRSQSRASKETRQADAFIQTSDRMIRWLQGRRKVLIAGLAGMIVVGVGYGTYSWLKKNRETEAQAAFFSAEKNYLELREKRQSAEDEYEAALQSKKTAKAAKKGEFYPSGDLAADYGPALERFKQVIASHPDSQAASLAALSIGQIYIDYKLYEQAEKELATLADSLADNGLLAGLIDFQSGLIAEAQGQCLVAIERWQVALNNSATGFLSPNAILKQAVCYETSNNQPKAKELYQELIEKHGDTTAGKNAKIYLRLLQSKSPQEG